MNFPFYLSVLIFTFLGEIFCFYLFGNFCQKLEDDILKITFQKKKLTHEGNKMSLLLTSYFHSVVKSYDMAIILFELYNTRDQ